MDSCLKSKKPTLKLIERKVVKQPAVTSRGGINLLELIPCRNSAWIVQKHNPSCVAIIVPRFRSKWGMKFCKLIKKRPSFHVNLDEYGSTVWKLCNGKNTVRDIGKKLRAKFGNKIEPLYERLSAYLRTLERNRFIVMYRARESGT
jgi:hypothetical protein